MRLVRLVSLLAVLSCDNEAGQTGGRASSLAPASSTPVAGNPDLASSTTAAVAATAPPTTRVGAARSPEHGVYLATADGRALYLLEEDVRGSSSCYEMCAAIWPPFLAGPTAPIASDPAVRTTLLGTVPRRGGGLQVSYNGQPLYLYLGDAGPAQTRGQHVEDSWGEWYLVSPLGPHVETEGRGRGRNRDASRSR